MPFIEYLEIVDSINKQFKHVLGNIEKVINS